MSLYKTGILNRLFLQADGQNFRAVTENTLSGINNNLDISVRGVCRQRHRYELLVRRMTRLYPKIIQGGRTSCRTIYRRMDGHPFASLAIFYVGNLAWAY